MSEPSKLNVVILESAKLSSAEKLAMMLAANEAFFPDDDDQLSALMAEVVSEMNISDSLTVHKSVKLSSSVVIGEATTDYHRAVKDAMQRRGIIVMPDDQFDSDGKAQCFAVWLSN